MNLYDFVDSASADKDFKYPQSSFIHKNLTVSESISETSSEKKYKVAIIGIPDEMEGNSYHAANAIRKNLYSLVALSGELEIIDLGNIKQGKSFKDTCYALCEVYTYFLKKNTILLQIGGSSEFDQGNLLAYVRNQEPLNLISIDSGFSLENIKPLAADIPVDKHLYNFTNIGYQRYLVERSALDYATDNFFEAYRLGEIRNNMKEMEPLLRDANHISISMNAVKHADAPGAKFPSPNGLSGDELCQLSFFAGHGIRLKSLGIYNLRPEKDIHEITSMLAAQTLWYFLEGLSNAIYEEPDITQGNFITYIIHHNDTDADIAFYKSSLTNRWWMEISSRDKIAKTLLSCSQDDYNQACRQEIPERWWKTYHRQIFLK